MQSAECRVLSRIAWYSSDVDSALSTLHSALRKAARGFEPRNKGFADLCLTTWLRRHRIHRRGRRERREKNLFLLCGLCVLCGEIMERETGFEPATSTLARLHSTTELFPPKTSISTARKYSRKNRKCPKTDQFLFTMESVIIAKTFCCSGSFLSITARHSDRWNF